MKLIVGLGNPEKERKHTRHNIARMFLDYIIERSNYLDKTLQLKTIDEKLCSYYIYNDIVYLYCNAGMNDSGTPVKYIMKKFNIQLKDLLVILDDVNLKCGEFKIRYTGSDGRHKGLGSILKIFNTENIARLRIGIDKPYSKDITMFDYVLSDFDIYQLFNIMKVFPYLRNAINIWNDFNDKPDIVMTNINKNINNYQLDSND